jgi:hypothetical protein
LGSYRLASATDYDTSVYGSLFIESYTFVPKPGGIDLIVDLYFNPAGFTNPPNATISAVFEGGYVA